MNFFCILTFALSQSYSYDQEVLQLISRLVICNTLVENCDHNIIPNLSIIFPYVPIT